jgi:GNAT superfamily N-acetyltransferase
MTTLRCRRYRPADRLTCAALFDSNVPTAFLPSERDQFLAFIDGQVGPYLVIENRTGVVIGCGGLATRGTVADLCWGLVGSRFHRQGVGRFLLRVRLAMAAAIAGVEEVAMNTSSDAAPFFEREGLTTTKVTQDYFREGLHKHDMRLVLTEEARQSISLRLTETLEAGHQVEAGILRSR